MLERKHQTPPPGLVVAGPREKLSRATLQHLIDKISNGGFVSCRLALSMYHEHPYRAYREVPGQAIRFRVFNVRALAELLTKVDDVTLEVERG